MSGSFIEQKKIGALGNSLVLVDSSVNHQRWLDAYGDVDKAIVDSVWKADEFVITASGTSPITASVVPGAVALITTGGTEYNGDNIQLVGSRFKLEASKPVYFGAKLTLSEATQADFLVGLCGVDTTLTAASSAHALDIGAGGVFFAKLDAVTTTHFKAYATTSETGSAIAGTMDTAAHIYEMYWDGTTLVGYRDGVAVGSFTAGLPTVVLTPSIAVRAGDGNPRTLTLHWMRTIKVNS